MTMTSVAVAAGCAVLGLALVATGERRRNDSVRVRNLLAPAGSPSGRLSSDRSVQALRVASRMGPVARRLASPRYRALLDDRLARAGLSRSVTAEEIIVAQVFGALVGGALAAGLLKGRVVPSQLAPLMTVVAVGVGALAPWTVLERRISTRRTALLSRLPDFLDLLTLSVEAGLAFDSAMIEVAGQIEGPIGEEMQRVLADVSLGQSRIDALEALDRRVGLPEVGAFVLAVTQALELGAPIGQVLRSQAATARLRQRQREQERMNRLPVKILVPTALLILPPTLVVVLGPSLSTIGAMFE